MSNNTTDYGEPWEYRKWHGLGDIQTDSRMIIRDAHFINAEDRERILACVNACAGLADPAEALRLAREALELFARLEIPDKPVGNAGMYSLPFERIQKAKQALSALTPNKK